MATQAHCAYCFECLTASLEHRQPLTLRQVEELWTQYEQGDDELDGADDTEMTDVEEGDADDEPPRPAAVSRILDSKNNSSTTTSSSSLASQQSSKPQTPASSSSSTISSIFSHSSRSKQPSSSSSSTSIPGKSYSSTAANEPSHPLFVTWNTLSSSGRKSLRGCIGTFEPNPLSSGLHSFALTSAFDDQRFSPITLPVVPSLQCCVTLLTNFSAPEKDPMNWTLGTHGLRLGFSYHGKRYGATYLPDVAKEQGWNKEETIVSLMRKAGWSGRSDEWRKVAGLEIVRYEGKKVDLDYRDWKEFRKWVETKGVEREALN